MANWYDDMTREINWNECTHMKGILDGPLCKLINSDGTDGAFVKDERSDMMLIALPNNKYNDIHVGAFYAGHFIKELNSREEILEWLKKMD